MRRADREPPLGSDYRLAGEFCRISSSSSVLKLKSKRCSSSCCVVSVSVMVGV